VKPVLAAAAGIFVVVLLMGAGIYSLATPTTAPLAETHSAPDVANAPAEPFTGISSGCTETDPTRRDGCLTPATAWLYSQTEQHFGQLPASCWDAHAWNPTSDHPQGRACDFTIGTAGQFPDEADREHGWQVATWLTDNAAALDIAYVIWNGQIWSAKRTHEGWRTYTGGGVYDVSTPIGGHYDHVHVSVRG